jgi:hypothetical protein
MSRRAEGALLAGCAAVYLLVATRAGTGITRTQFDNRAYSQFFDLQADALLRGDLALPENSIGIEAFVVDGREQMYFGLFPALARLPVSALTDAWFGELTVISSFLAWLVFVVSAWALTDRVADTADKISVPVVVVWKVAVALGTPMLMLAGPAWVFSEAIMWGVAATVLFQWRLYCELQEPSLRNELWLGAALVLAALNRPTLAIGCLLVTVVLVAIRARSDRPSAVRLGGWATASAVVLIVPNLIRFGRPLGPPMELQVLSQVDEQRMRMLSYAGGDFVDVRYTPSTLLAYLRPDGVSVGSRFPFVDAPSDTPRVFLDAVFDITYRTPSIVATSTLLVAAAVVGAVVAVGSFRHEEATRRLVLAAAAGVPAAATLFVWGFIAPRYLADFVALLVPLGVLGTVRLAAWGATAERRRWLVGGAAVLAAWSVTANAAMAVSSSYVTGPDGGAAELVRLQGRGDWWTAERFADPEDFAFDRSDPPPPGMIAVLGDCDAAYLSNGEPVDPWLALAYGPADFRRGFEVTLPDELFDASILLGSFTANEPNVADEPTAFELRLVTDPSGATRLELSDEFGMVPYPLDVSVGESFELTVTSDPVRRSMFFDLDGETVHYGHYLTRSLFEDGGQTVVFTDGGENRGVVVDALPAPPRPC